MFSSAFGVILGPLIPYLFSIVTYLTDIVLYLSLVAGSLVSSVFQFFLPALIALLFVELKEKTVNDSFSTSNGVSTEENHNQSSTSVV